MTGLGFRVSSSGCRVLRVEDLGCRGLPLVLGFRDLGFGVEALGSEGFTVEVGPLEDDRHHHCHLGHLNLQTIMLKKVTSTVM